MSDTYGLPPADSAANLIGRTAREILRDGVRGHVMAVVSKAVYLEMGDGDILWIHGTNVPPHARGIQSDHVINRISAGEWFGMSGTGLLLDSGIKIETNAASVWSSPEPDSRHRIPLPRLPERLVEFHDAYFSVSPGSMLAFDNPLSVGVFPASSTPKPKPDGVFHRERSSMVSRILDCCHKRDLLGALDRGGGLIGLGDGLTPAGDDFLGGLLFAVFTLEQSYRLTWMRCPEELDTFLRIVHERTHAISYTLLADHARGSGVEPLHQFINSFMSTVPIVEALRYARQVERIGGSTGRQLIAGVLAGVTLVVASPSSGGEFSRRQIQTVESGK